MQLSISVYGLCPCQQTPMEWLAGSAVSLYALAVAAQVNFLDWIVFNVAMLCTMFAGVDLGLAISIGLSIVLALYKSAFPKTSVLGQLPETTVFRFVPFCPQRLSQTEAGIFWEMLGPRDFMGTGLHCASDMVLK